MYYQSPEEGVMTRIVLSPTTEWFLIFVIPRWADKIESKGSDGKVRLFNHPFVQSCFMFFGEFLCLLTFKLLYFYCKRKGDGSENQNGFVKGNRNFSPFILFIPACCDMIATSIMYIGLNLTYASSFQMLRGSVIVFVGFLSFAFLGRVFLARQWSGILFIISGLVSEILNFELKQK